MQLNTTYFDVMDRTRTVRPVDKSGRSRIYFDGDFVGFAHVPPALFDNEYVGFVPSTPVASSLVFTDTDE